MVGARRPTRPIRTERRARAVAAGAVALGGLALGRASLATPASDAADPDRRMTLSEVPAVVLEPTRAGDGSVASFAAFLATVRSFHHGRPVWRPDTVEGISAVTDVAGHGRIASLELVPRTEQLGDLTAARIDLVLTVDGLRLWKSDDRVDARVWTRTLWMGDPVLAGGMLARLREELGAGPVGATVVIFGNVTDTPEGPVLGVFDGIVDDAGAVARLSLVVAEPVGELRSSAVAVAAGPTGG